MSSRRDPSRTREPAIEAARARFRGCLLGGAITDDTQMTLFTAEGLLHGWAEGCTDGHACLLRATHLAYRRWALTQGGDRAAMELLNGEAGAPAVNDSKGCGGVTRVAPAGLFFWRPEEALSLRPAFNLGAELAGLTHGHPTGRLAAGVLAVLVLALVGGARLPDALAAARGILSRYPHHEETLAALTRAETLAASGVPHEAALGLLGGGWVAEEALAIAVYCALVAGSFEEGVVLAVNHDGDSDSTGAIAGNLLGAMHGAAAIPDYWLGPLELRERITGIADQLLCYWAARAATR